MVQQRLHKLLMEDTVETPAHQPWMEDHGVEPALAVVHIPASVEGTGMDKKTISRGKDMELRDFLAIQTGLKWTRSANLLSFRIKDLTAGSSDNYKGPRLPL